MTDARRRTVLVVDDDPMLRAMASTALRHAGFVTAEADGGAAALAAHDPSSLALVLLDVMMPDVDGYEVCRSWRSRPEAADLPILMLTGLSDADSIERAYAVGATDFIVKPVHWRLLVQRVRYALRAAAAAESARRSRERLERAQRMARMGSWELALGEHRLACSPELAHALGFELPENLVADASLFLRYVHEQDRGTVEAARHKACREGAPYLINYRIRRPDGSERFVVEQASPVRDASGRLVAVEGITQDVTDRVEAQRQISRLARQDPVTGLPNRTFFHDVAAVSLERAARLRTACALLHLDVNRFKQVNDAYGRAEGDAVLRTLAERLQASIRSSDIATVGGTSGVPVLARVGGNAFTLLLVDVGGERQAEMVAERLLRAIAAPLVVHGHELVLGASLGIAMFPRDAREAEALERCAEQAVYAAKGTGRAQIRFFDEEINGRAGARLAREAELRRAIAEDQLRLHYQPKFDAARGVIVGGEALVRWQHPERGLVSPGEFIPLAEETGLIGPLTEWVLETACADQARRLAAGIVMVSVAVNLSSAIFGDDALGTRLAALVARHGLEARWLTLEVTESLLMQDVERAVPRLQELRERGFALSLDDFGTGYSSLGYLKRFPIDELKIDRSFVVDATRGGRDAALAASIIALGRELGLVVVAEGVETPAQSRFLLQQGCVCQQGFLFARPLPAEGFDALLGRVAGATAPA